MDKERQEFLWGQKLKKRLKYNHTLSILFLFIVVGYAFFFTSSSWLQSTEDWVTPTPINSVRTWNDREITLLSWEYSEEQQIMEVQLNVKNKSFDGIDSYEYSAMIRDKGYVQVEEVINQGELVVLRIHNISKKWSEISLRLGVKDGDSSCKLYTTQKDITRVKKIEDLTYNQYMIARLQNMISIYMENIQDMEKNIQIEQNNIENCNKKITEYKAQEEYQTIQEIEETENMIREAQRVISNSENLIESYKASIEEFRARIKNVEEQIEKYK